MRLQARFRHRNGDTRRQMRIARSMEMLLAPLAILALGACEPPRPVELVYLDGRAVEPVGDSLLSFTSKSEQSLILLAIGSKEPTIFGSSHLTSPVHVQQLNGDWYISDTDQGNPVIVVLGPDGSPKRRLDVSNHTSLLHQFAILPDGRIVLQAKDSRLVALDDDTVTTFALTEVGSRPSLITAAGGGVLHAVPDHHITLYNGFGNIRWRIEWPWRESAFVTDVSVDRLGRIHLLVSGEEPDTFIVFTIQQDTGEVIRWSVPGPYATFVVSVFGEVRPDSTDNWVRRGN